MPPHTLSSSQSRPVAGLGSATYAINIVAADPFKAHLSHFHLMVLESPGVSNTHASRLKVLMNVTSSVADGQKISSQPYNHIYNSQNARCTILIGRTLKYIPWCANFPSVCSVLISSLSSVQLGLNFDSE